MADTAPDQSAMPARTTQRDSERGSVPIALVLAMGFITTIAWVAGLVVVVLWLVGAV